MNTRLILFSHLPRDILILIIAFIDCDARFLCKLMFLNKQFNALIKNSHLLWKNHLPSLISDEDAKNPNTNYSALCKEKIAFIKCYTRNDLQLRQDLLTNKKDLSVFMSDQLVKFLYKAIQVKDKTMLDKIYHLGSKHTIEGYTTFHWAMICNQYDDCVDFIKRDKRAVSMAIISPMNKTPFNKYRPIHIATELNITAIAELLLNNGASVDERNPTEKTALHLACKKGHYDMVKLLLKHHAQIDLEYYNSRRSCKHSTCKTPLAFAFENNHWDVMELLVSRGAKDSFVRLASDTGTSPLLTKAVKNNNEKAVNILLQTKKYSDAFLFEALHSTQNEMVIQSLTVYLYENALDRLKKLLEDGSQSNHFQIWDNLKMTQQEYSFAEKILASINNNQPFLMDIQKYTANTSSLKAILNIFLKIDLRLLANNQKEITNTDNSLQRKSL